MKSTVNGPAGVVLACFLALFAVPAGAAGELLDEKGIASSLSGITLDGVYHDGGFFSETYAAGGGITYRDRNGKADGNWSIKDGLFCTFYENQQGACFFVRRDGKCAGHDQEEHNGRDTVSHGRPPPLNN